MKLENIGFYTLSDNRAKHCSMTSPLWRCELILTDRCNFHCPYCRGLHNGADLPFEEAVRILNYWFSEGLKNIRFSGGEPTLYYGLIDLVRGCKDANVEHIAISTNGSASLSLYKDLVSAGVNDFSISLDACCSSTGDTMAGKRGAWETVIKNIKELSKLTYTTVGIVLNGNNVQEAKDTIILADKLGVQDICVIPSAQYSKHLKYIHQLNSNPDAKISAILDKHPILKYRLTNKRNVRGLSKKDTCRCPLVLDDMAVWNGEHYPCIIYLREGGKPIGDVNKNTREDRFNWYTHHNAQADPICKHNCLDVCRQYNNTVCSR